MVCLLSGEMNVENALRVNITCIVSFWDRTRTAYIEASIQKCWSHSYIMMNFWFAGVSVHKVGPFKLRVYLQHLRKTTSVPNQRVRVFFITIFDQAFQIKEYNESRNSLIQQLFIRENNNKTIKQHNVHKLELLLQCKVQGKRTIRE